MRHPSSFHVVLRLTMSLGAASLSAAAPAQPKAADIVAKMPANSVQEGQQLAAQLINLGPAGLKEVCRMLKPMREGGDAKARYAIAGVVMRAARPGGEADRKIVAAVFCKQLPGKADAEVKQFFIRQLEVVGRDDAVPAVAAALRDAKLCGPAARALQAIGSPAAVTALAAALPKAQGPSRLAILQTLGQMRAKAAADAMAQFVASDDSDLRHEAWHALANMGDARVAKPLEAAMKAKSLYERQLAAKCYLLWLRRLAEAGDKAQCAQRCRKLIDHTTEAKVASAALRQLVAAADKAALPDLLAAAASENKEFREAALKLGQTLPGADVTQQWVAAMQKAKPEVKVDVLAMLAKRGDKAALPALLAALKDKDKTVRLAAIDAAQKLGGADAAPALLAALKTDQADEVKAIQAALMRMKGPSLMAAIAAAIPKSPAAARVALLDVLAARRAAGQAEAVFAATSDKESRVRAAALKALGSLAQPNALPRLIALYLGAKSSRETSAAFKSVVDVANKIDDPEKRADAVLAEVAKSQGAVRAKLLGPLARIGGKKALETVLADMTSADAKVADAAVRALADWRDASAAPHMIQVAQTSKNLAHQVLCLRGYIRVVGDAKSLDAAAKVAKLKTAMAAAKRPDEKRLVLAALGKIRSIESLELAATCLDDPALAKETCEAVVKIACPVVRRRRIEKPGLVGKSVRDVLLRALKASRVSRVRKALIQHLENMPVPDELNLAWGRPVKTNVPQEHDRAPERAVDGNAADRVGSAWYGHRTPAWLQVDLGKEYEIDTAHVTFYWDGKRYYQYTVDVSLDGKTWKTVADQSKNTEVSMSRGKLLAFAPVKARYVRLHVLKNSVNPACHVVEFKVYEKGKHPLAGSRAEKPKPDAEGFVPLFNGKDLTGWVGSVYGYVAEDGKLVCLKKGGGYLYTEDEYSDFILRFEFKLTPGGNNGVGIRVPLGKGAAYAGMEIQILDNTAKRYAKLHPYQYHGSIYGVVPAKRGHLKPVGEWNYEEIIANGRQITVKLNGVTIVDADIDKASTPKTMDGKPHPGLKRTTGRICFCGHGARVEFRNIRIKELKPAGK